MFTRIPTYQRFAKLRLELGTLGTHYRPRPNLLARASHELLVSLHVNGPAPSLLHISSGTVRPSIHL